MNEELWLNGQKISLKNICQKKTGISFFLDGHHFDFVLLKKTPHSLVLEHQNQRFKIIFDKDQFLVQERECQITVRPILARKKKVATKGDLTSPMPGRVLKIMVQEGGKVKKGGLLLVVEAMKMEHSIKAPRAGVVEKIFFRAGEQVEGGAQLLTFAKDKGPSSS